MNVKRSSLICLVWLILALMAGLALWTMQKPFAAAVDAPVNLRSAYLFHLNLMDNLQWPDWDATAFGGRGSPILRYLGVLPLFLASIFQLAGADVFLAVKLVVVLYAIMGLLGLLYLIRLMKLSAETWLLPLLLLQPITAFHLGWVFLFLNLCGQFLSTWLWAYAVKIIRGETVAIKGAAITMAMICLTHPQSAMMLGYMWVILLFAAFVSNGKKECLSAVFLVPLLGGLLAAPYLLPLVMTGDHVYYKEVNQYLKPGTEDARFLNAPFLNFENKQASLIEVLSAAMAISAENHAKTGLNQPVFSDLSSAQKVEMIRPWLLLNVVILVALSLAGAIRWPNNEGVISGWVWLIPGLFCVFLTTSWSSLLYRFLPGINNVQFPWRWILPAAVFMLPQVASAVRAQTQETIAGKPHKGIISAAIWLGRAGVLILVLMTFWVQSLFYQMPAGLFATFMANPGHLEPFQPKVSSLSENIPYHSAAPHQVKLLTGTGTIEEHKTGTTNAEITVLANTESELIINTHNDGLWRVLVNNTLIQPETASNSGLMKIVVNEGRQKIVIERQEPPGRNTGWLIAILTFALLMAVRHGKDPVF